MTPLLYAITLCWDPSPEADISKYQIYVDNVPRIESVTNRGTISELETNKIYSFNVTAINSSGLESDKSETLKYVVPHVEIINNPLRVKFPKPLDNNANVRYHLESTIDFTAWAPEPYLQLEDTAYLIVIHATPHKFYRVRLEIIKEGCAE